MIHLAQQAKVVVGALGLANAGATTGDYVSMKGFGHCSIIVALTPASGTDASTITLKQATAVAGTAEKALAFTRMWKNADVAAADTLTSTAVTSSTFNSSIAAKQELFIIEVDAADLDAQNDFDCLRVDVTDPGSVSTPLAVIYVLSGGRFQGGSPPSAITD